MRANASQRHITHAVLDKGFVSLVDHMGDDYAVVDAARVCVGSKSVDDDKDKKLVRYLYSHKHMTPFEHAVFKFKIKAPLFVARQWFRHRTSSYNEVSQRYTIVADEFYHPEKWRAQEVGPGANKQGSVNAPLDHAGLTNDMDEHERAAMKLYNAMLAKGVAKEMARMVLPVNIYTEWFWTVNARNLMAFLELRSDKHAQWEIRQYSNALWPIFAAIMPWSAEAFMSKLNLADYAAGEGEIAGINHGAIPA